MIHVAAASKSGFDLNMETQVLSRVYGAPSAAPVAPIEAMVAAAIQLSH